MATIDISCDLGEGYGSYRLADDAALLDIVTSANVACGFHGGDPRIMAHTVQESIARGVGVGAHPGFPDLVGFGRRDMALSAEEIFTDVLYQLGALSAFVDVYGGHLQHMSPHGQLGNIAVYDHDVALHIAEAVARYDPNLIILTDKGELTEVAQRKGLRVAYEIYADRAYNDDGTLVSRKQPGAVITDPELVVKRAVEMVTDQKVTTISGRTLRLEGHSLCIHGDTPGSVALARRVRDGLVAAGITVAPVGKWLTH